MNYICKNKTPEELLIKLGFEKSNDRGWQIIIKSNKNKFDNYNNSTWIPRKRIHALFFENQLNIHFDDAIKGKKHKSFQRIPIVLEIMEKIKELDI
jgi:hypothetical protein